MTKIKLPYSIYPMLVLGIFLALGISGIITATWLPLNLDPSAVLDAFVLAIAVVGGLVEFIGGTALMVKLQSSNKFEYESIYGKLLGQFTILRSVSVTEIQVLVGARLAACMILGFNLLWGNVFAVVLFLLTTIHYVPNKKPRH